MSYNEHNFRNTHLEKYRSVFGSGSLPFQNSQVIYTKKIFNLEDFKFCESVIISPNALEVHFHKKWFCLILIVIIIK